MVEFMSMMQCYPDTLAQQRDTLLSIRHSSHVFLIRACIWLVTLCSL